MPEAAFTETLTPERFVTKDAFNIHVESMRNRAASDGKWNDSRFDHLETLMEKNAANHTNALTEFKNEVNVKFQSMDNRLGRVEKNVDRLSEKVEAIGEDVSEMKGDIKALTVRMAAHETRFGWYLALLGLMIAAIQLWK